MDRLRLILKIQLRSTEELNYTLWVDTKVLTMRGLLVVLETL